MGRWGRGWRTLFDDHGPCPMPSYGPPPRRLRRHDENGAAETDGEDDHHSEDVAVVQSDLALCLLGTNSIEHILA